MKKETAKYNDYYNNIINLTILGYHFDIIRKHKGAAFKETEKEDI